MNCKNCGAELKENQKFCPKCGTALAINSESDGDETATLVKSTLKRQKKLQTLIIVFGILLFISVAFFSISCWQYANAKQMQEIQYNEINLQSVTETTEQIVSNLEQFKKDVQYLVKLYQTTDTAVIDEKVNSMVEISELETRRTAIKNLFDMHAEEMEDFGFTDWRTINDKVYEQCNDTIADLKDWRKDLIDFGKITNNLVINTSTQKSLNSTNVTILNLQLKSLELESNSLKSYEDTFTAQMFQWQKQIEAYLAVIMVSIVLMVISVAVIIASHRKKKCYY